MIPLPSGQMIQLSNTKTMYTVYPRKKCIIIHTVSCPLDIKPDTGCEWHSVAMIYIVQYVYQWHATQVLFRRKLVWYFQWISGLVIWSGCYCYTHCISRYHPNYNNTTIYHAGRLKVIGTHWQLKPKQESSIHVLCKVATDNFLTQECSKTLLCQD